MFVTRRSAGFKKLFLLLLAVCFGCFSTQILAQPLSGAIFTTTIDGSVVNGHSIREAMVMGLRSVSPPPVEGVSRRQDQSLVVQIFGADGEALECGAGSDCVSELQIVAPASGFLKLVVATDPYVPGAPYPAEVDLSIEVSGETPVKIGTLPVGSMGRVEYLLRIAHTDDGSGEPPVVVQLNAAYVNRETGETNAAVAMPAYQTYADRARFSEVLL